ncbi:ACT domain-containing protein [Flavobacterium cellulosilyticum]|uniref:ACT domain-containing protein n=1 Tax=Flavobacterium cellulosilyticum TaxID=2541731 RepID=A0A4R5C460_9FLAO|nr:ACT domain-containing protein [Flavobacterium cellulosilyticum]TDD94398.1 ACT domain-containing protein [Flavobacterium cellulosilyticum]
MSGELNLEKLLKTMKPKQNLGEYVFCVIENLDIVKFEDILMTFKEEEGITIILRKEIADSLLLNYSFIASWITLTVNSSLEAVGLTAAFSKALSDNQISCNVVAGFYHDHIFVDIKDIEKALRVLNAFSL